MSFIKKIYESLTSSLMAVAIGAALLAHSPNSAAAQSVLSDDGSGMVCSTLYAGQTIDAGTVCVSSDGTDLFVTYVTTGGWELTEAHLWVGANTADMPQTKQGNPKIGNFPGNSGDITGEIFYEFTISLADLGFFYPSVDVVYFLAAHAALQRDNGDGTFQTETGWGDGSRFVERGMWGTFSSFTLTCESDPGPEPKGERETAFACGGDLALDFLQLDLNGDGKDDFNRWGWTNLISPGNTYTFPIYAGAGQSDITKGTWVGDLEVTYSSDGALNVVYIMFEGFTMQEMHIYAGSEPVPTNENGDYTVAPGQYSVVQDEIPAAGWSHAWVVGDGFSGNLYLIAHAVVCDDE